MKHDHKPMAGTTVNEAADTLVALAKEKGRAVTCDFNGVVLTATPTTDAASILGHYDAEMAIAVAIAVGRFVRGRS